MSTTTDRTYLVGIPVVVTIEDDGTITLGVCAEEAGEAMAEQGAPAEDVSVVTDAIRAVEEGRDGRIRARLAG